MRTGDNKLENIMPSNARHATRVVKADLAPKESLRWTINYRGTGKGAQILKKGHRGRFFFFTKFPWTN